MLAPDRFDARHLPPFAARPFQRRRQCFLFDRAREHRRECTKHSGLGTRGSQASIIIRFGGHVEFRRLGYSGFKVPVLSFGTGTFGGSSEFFRAWGDTDVSEARRLVDICLDSGVNMFDTADVYSAGRSEEILGKAVAGRRDKVIIATKASFPMGSGPNDRGTSRYHLLSACEASLRRLGTDYIDLYQMHGFDAL